MTRTIVFGFDALDFAYLDKFADSLPTLSALRESGFESPLHSTHPPWTGSAWPSMYTGTDPSHHGIYDFFTNEGYPDEGEIVSNADVEVPALWEYLTAEGIPSIVLNVPVTHPAPPIEGVLIPGYLASEDEPGHPEGIREEVSAAIGEPYTIYADGEVSDDPDAKLAGYLDLLDRRRRAATYLLTNHDWELAVIQVQKTDAVFHNFDDEDAFRAVYERADRLVDAVLGAIDDEPGGEDVNVVVCSDHGMRPVRGYTVYVNEVLAEHGYVEPADGDDRPTLETEKSALVAGDRPQGGNASGADETAPAGEGMPDDESDASIGERLASSVVAAARRAGVSPADVYALAGRVGLERALLALTPDSLRSAAARSVDWRTSRAYCPASTQLGVRVNLEGREPNGVVPPEEYEDVRDDLIELLSELRTPDGDPVFGFVHRREAVYEGGSALEHAPDVVFRPTGMNHRISASLYGRRFVPVDAYDHRSEGVFVATGPDVQTEEASAVTQAVPAVDGGTAHADASTDPESGTSTTALAKPREGPPGDPGGGSDERRANEQSRQASDATVRSTEHCSLTDVAPTVLALLDHPVAAGMTGEVPAALGLEYETRDYGDVRLGTGDALADDAVVSRLEDLGYR